LPDGINVHGKFRIAVVFDKWNHFWAVPVEPGRVLFFRKVSLIDPD
jgi:hypothetical protein